MFLAVINTENEEKLSSLEKFHQAVAVGRRGLVSGCAAGVDAEGSRKALTIATAQSDRHSLTSFFPFLSIFPVIIGMFGGLSLSVCCLYHSSPNLVLRII
jgi:hypothetical protein